MILHRRAITLTGIMQPAMGEDRHAIPLRIMSYPKRLLADEFETMRDVLYCHVYRQK